MSVKKELSGEAFSKNVKITVKRYTDFFPEERAGLNKLVDVANLQVDLRSRLTIPDGHICSNAIILSPDYKKILLLKHKSLKIWVIPGGHYDLDDNSPERTALREAKEETGLDLEIHPWHATSGIPLDIAVNAIPANSKKNEGEHSHFDFSYVVKKSPEGNIKIDQNESDDYMWVGIEEKNFFRDGMLSRIVNKLPRIISTEKNIEPKNKD